MPSQTHRRALGAIVAGAVVAFCFAGSLLAALHSPEPHDLPVALVGPTQGTTQVRDAIHQRQPDAFDLRGYPDAEHAEQAVRERDVAGAFILAPGDAPRLVVAGGNGVLATQVLERTFTAVAGATGAQPQIDDVAPLPDGDRVGASSFMTTIGTLVGSLVVAVALSAVAGTLGVGLLLAVLTVSGLTVGGLAAWLADGLSGALVGSPLQLWAAFSLFSFAVTASVVALARLLGHPGIGLAALVLVILGVPAAGGPFGAEFVPTVYGWLSDVLPASAAVTLVRRITYFDGNNVGAALTTLTCWAATALVVLGAVGLVGRRRGSGSGPAEPEATGDPVDGAALYR